MRHIQNGVIKSHLVKPIRIDVRLVSHIQTKIIVSIISELSIQRHKIIQIVILFLLSKWLSYQSEVWRDQELNNIVLCYCKWTWNISKARDQLIYFDIFHWRTIPTTSWSEDDKQSCLYWWPQAGTTFYYMDVSSIYALRFTCTLNEPGWKIITQSVSM